MTGTYSKVNMCKSTGKPMSTCDGAKDPKEQENCTYYEKASNASRCMYLVFGEYCDNFYAQKGIAKPEEKKEEEKK